MARISARFRLALAGKGALLLALGLVFAALFVTGVLGGQRRLVVRVVCLLFALPGLFLVRMAARAFADAVLGHALQVPGAVALASRRAGHSLRLPDGHFAEFILHNPWSPLVAERRYAVTIGRYSRVLVEPPRLEG